MSSRRYFSQGTDFYRVLYDNGSIDGPYIKPGVARGIGNRSIAPRIRYRYIEGVRCAEEYFRRKSYKLQKLMPVLDDCMGEAGHEMYLEWKDVEE